LHKIRNDTQATLDSMADPLQMTWHSSLALSYSLRERALKASSKKKHN